MAKDKDTVKGSDDSSPGSGGDKPEVLKASGLVAAITTEEQAISLIKTLYTVPDGCKIAFVTEDRNVFWQQNEGPAVKHAQKNNLKIFRCPV